VGVSEESGGVSGGGLENTGVWRQTNYQTVARQLLKFANEHNALGCLVVVSGVWCLVPKVLLSVWGGFLRNPQTRHSGQMN